MKITGTRFYGPQCRLALVLVGCTLHRLMMVSELVGGAVAELLEGKLGFSVKFAHPSKFLQGHASWSLVTPRVFILSTFARVTNYYIVLLYCIVP